MAKNISTVTAARRRALEAPTLTRFRIATDESVAANFTAEEREIAVAAFRRDNGLTDQGDWDNFVVANDPARARACLVG